MGSKTDVKAIMARFQANGSNTEEATSSSAGHPKQPVHPTLSGPGLHTKRTLTNSPSSSGAAVPAKPSYLKNSPSPNSGPVVHELNKTKALAGKFANSQENTRNPFVKQTLQTKASFGFAPEPKAPPSKPGLSPTGSDPKPACLKPVVVNAKPSWVRQDATPPASPSATKMPPAQLKPSNNFFKLQQQIGGKAEVTADCANKATLPVNGAVKPSNFRAAQNLFAKEPQEQQDCGVKPSVAGKPPPAVSMSTPPPKPPSSKKPSLKKPSPHTHDLDPSAPKKNPLPNSLALGQAPAKPNRPPNVDLEVFVRASETHSEGKSCRVSEKSIAPAPPPHPGNHSNCQTPAPPAAPSLPPRHPGAINQKEAIEEIYDDVDGQSDVPPPLPPVHPSQMSKRKDGSDDDDEDGDMYEALDERWTTAEQKREQNKEKDEKEERKRLETEKREQKEREKKENEARKKFKLKGPLEVLQRVKAICDCKGNKTDLSLKQGDSLDIIRILDNPEGKWLGRSPDGSIGYVKTTSVNIDFNALKQQSIEQAQELEVYDDVDMTPAEQSKTKGGGVVVPPPPADGEEIYDDVDSNLSGLSASSSFKRDSDPKGGAVDEEIYDDVDAQSTPPLPPISSIPKIDLKKQKKFEKEEKDFRKKFKYDGEIRALHQVTIVPQVTNKKWSGKELPLKPGEKLDVIVQAVDNKYICRNEDGKLGYVSTCYVVADDGDIYDDIGDDSIYDND